MKVPNPPGSGKDIAKVKGVHREVESEGRRRQNSGLTDRNRIEAVSEGKTAQQVKAQKLHGIACSKYGRYKSERTCEYPGRSHGRVEFFLRGTVETRFVVRSQQIP